MKFTLPNIYFIIAIGIATAYLTFLTTKGGLTNNSYKKLWKKLTFRGWLVLFVLLSMIGILVLQEINNQNINDNKDEALSKETAERDSIITFGIKSGVDSNRRKLFDDLSKSFAAQNLRLDTLENTVIRIKDSVKTVNNFAQDDPVLLIKSDGITLDTLSRKYSVTFESGTSGSSNFKISYYLLTKYSDGYDLSKHNLFPDNLKIPKNGSWTTGYSCYFYYRIQEQYIYLKGSYTTIDGTKSYKIDDIYQYDLNKNKISMLLNIKRNEILNIINSVPESKLIKK
jgi:hypothetical protein